MMAKKGESSYELMEEKANVNTVYGAPFRGNNM